MFYSEFCEIPKNTSGGLLLNKGGRRSINHVSTVAETDASGVILFYVEKKCSWKKVLIKVHTMTSIRIPFPV